MREDPKNKDLLYVGTEFALFVSTNGGREWKRFMNDFPTVRVDDILVHPRDGDLIIATHGRSGAARRVLGSVADKTLRGATTPILLYRPPKEALEV